MYAVLLLKVHVGLLESIQILKEKGTQAGKEEIDDADQGFQSVVNIHAQ